MRVAAASVIASMGATTAFATTYSTNNSKISEVQTSSVFVGSTRLSVEGDSLGNFAGFGVIDFNSNSLSVPDYTTVNGINGTTMTLNLVDRSPLDNFAKDGQVDFFLATGTNGSSSLSTYRFQGFASNGGAGTQLGSLTSLGSFNYTAGAASGRNDTVTLDFSSGGASVLSYLNSQLSTGGNVRIIAAPHSATVAANWQGSLTSTNTSPILNSPSLSFDLNTVSAPATDATFVLNPGAAKTLTTGPIVINRILTSSSTNVTVAVQNTGTGSGSFKFISTGSVTGSGGMSF